MTIRPYKPEDEPVIRAIYVERGYSFDFPDLNAADMVSIWVCEDEGRVVSAVAARKTVEISAFVAQDWKNPAWRLSAMMELQKYGSTDLASQGFTDQHCWVKSEIRGFGRRLVRSMGWIRSMGGDCFVRGL